MLSSPIGLKYVIASETQLEYKRDEIRVLPFPLRVSYCTIMLNLASFPGFSVAKQGETGNEDMANYGATTIVLSTY